MDSQLLRVAPFGSVAPGSRAVRNVWSAASPQAKCEDVTSWSAQMYTAFVGGNHSWPGWNALRSFPHELFSLKRLLPVTGLKSAGFDRCAISSFASRPGNHVLRSRR